MKVIIGDGLVKSTIKFYHFRYNFIKMIYALRNVNSSPKGTNPINELLLDFWLHFTADVFFQLMPYIFYRVEVWRFRRRLSHHVFPSSLLHDATCVWGHSLAGIFDFLGNDFE